MDDATARALLEQERERLLAVRRDLEGGTDEEGDRTSAPLHAADVASDVLEREVDQSIRHRVDEELHEVDDALRRLDAGTYGTCDTCGAALGAERLEAVPAARFCAEHEAMWEGDRLDLTVPAGRYEDGDAHTTDRAAAREAGRNLDLVGDQDEVAEPVEVAPEERALHLADPARPDPGARSAPAVVAREERRSAWDEDERRADRAGAEDVTDTGDPAGDEEER